MSDLGFDNKHRCMGCASTFCNANSLAVHVSKAKAGKVKNCQFPKEKYAKGFNPPQVPFNAGSIQP